MSSDKLKTPSQEALQILAKFVSGDFMSNVKSVLSPKGIILKVVLHQYFEIFKVSNWTLTLELFYRTTYLSTHFVLRCTKLKNFSKM